MILKNSSIPILILLLSFMMSSAITAQDQLEIESTYISEIDALAANAKVIEAMDLIVEMDSVTIANLIELVQIPAAPFKEEPRSEAFKLMLEEAGADKVWIDSEGNVLALRRGTDSEKTIAIDAHIDTVFPEDTDLTVTQRGDTLFAPGIGDDTRGLTMVHAILKALVQTDIRTKNDLLFIGTVGEEGAGDLRGVKHLFESGEVTIDSWISIDGGSIGRVNNAGLGSKRYRAMFTGPGGHSWGAFGLANPHHALGFAIKEFTEQAEVFTSDGARTSFNIGRIGGGTSVNSIPFESWMEVDMRSISPDRLDEIEIIFKQSMSKALAEYNATSIRDSVRLELIKMGDRPSGELSPTLPLIQRALAVTKFMGAEPRLTRGSTNSNIPIFLGVPAVTIGRGGKGSGAHSLDEWWMNDNGADAIKLALLLTLAEAEFNN